MYCARKRKASRSRRKASSSGISVLTSLSKKVHVKMFVIGFFVGSVSRTTRGSPVYRWPKALVEKSLCNLSQDGALAQVHMVWPLTMYDLEARVG